MKRYFFGLAFALSLTFTAFSQTVLEPTSLPSKETMASKMQAILRVTPQNRSYLPQIASLIKIPSNNAADLDDAIQRLVDVVDAGTTTDEFSSLLISKTKISISDNPQAEKDWIYGTYIDRINIIRLIWARAQLIKDNPARAASYTQAALLLAANEDFYIGATILAGMNRDLASIVKIGQMSAVQEEELRTFLQALVQSEAAESHATRAVISAEANLINAPDGPFSAALVEREIAALKEQWKIVRVNPYTRTGGQFHAIMNGWLLRNLAYAHKDFAAQKAINDLLQAWKQDSNDGPVNRWIDEALSSIGPADKYPRIFGPGVKQR